MEYSRASPNPSKVGALEEADSLKYINLIRVFYSLPLNAVEN
jgi:hypothetical protein